MHEGCVEHVESVGFLVKGTDSHLYRFFRDYYAFLRGARKHRAVIQALAVVNPGIEMSVKMD